MKPFVDHVRPILSRVLVTLALLAVALAGPANAFAQPASPADSQPEWRGLVESMPSGSLQGNWSVGGRIFSADAATQFEQEHGLLQVGVCAEVKYQTVGSGYQAVKIQSSDSDKCGGGGEQDAKAYATVDAMPAGGLIGNWTIGGVSYATTANTYFEQEHGGFAVGVCVEVDYLAGAPATATKIATESTYKCSGSGGGEGGSTPGSGEMYGTITSFPADLLGQWVIGGITFVTDSATRFQQEHGAFANGVLVDVKFYTDASAVNHATKIESKYATDDSGHDNDGNGSYEGYEGHAYGKVEVMPAGVGVWTIAGIQYSADAATRIEQEHGAIGVGTNVKVSYYLDAAGNRVARKIESSNETGGVTSPDHSKLYGTVEQIPANSFNGQWRINGVTLTADQSTIFQESHGLLAVGAYVEVEYYTQSDGGHWMTKIETQVPPGAGPDQHFGSIDDNPGAASISAGQATWIIGGKSFVVTPATDFNDINGALTPGNTALVNSYTDSTGAAVATQIRGLALNHSVYLPAMSR